MKIFDKRELEKLYKPDNDSEGEDNGSITIIGGSKLFHGAPILALKTASRIVDMVFFASPDPSVGRIAEKVRSGLMSFIWVPWDEVDHYVQKSDAVLIGPGMMRFASESQRHNSNPQIGDYDNEGKKTREITEKFLKKFPDKKWVIDAGSLQTMDAEWIPQNSILTPNKKELEMLFNIKLRMSNGKFNEREMIGVIQKKAGEHNCIIVAKGAETVIASSDDTIKIKGGNAGLTKGGSGDVMAGLAVALLAKNDPLLSAAAASFIEKKAADKLYEKVGTNYNMDDLTDTIPEVLGNFLKE